MMEKLSPELDHEIAVGTKRVLRDMDSDTQRDRFIHHLQKWVNPTFNVREWVKETDEPPIQDENDH